MQRTADYPFFLFWILRRGLPRADLSSFSGGLVGEEMMKKVLAVFVLVLFTAAQSFDWGEPRA